MTFVFFLGRMGLVILCMGQWYAQCGWITDRRCLSSICLQMIDLYLAFTDRRQSMRRAFDTGYCLECEVIKLSMIAYYSLHLSCCWYFITSFLLLKTPCLLDTLI